jgi:hypothetical protein
METWRHTKRISLRSVATGSCSRPSRNVGLLPSSDSFAKSMFVIFAKTALHAKLTMCGEQLGVTWSRTNQEWVQNHSLNPLIITIKLYSSSKQFCCKHNHHAIGVTCIVHRDPSNLCTYEKRIIDKQQSVRRVGT